VEGVWWPRRETRELDGEAVSSTTLRHLLINGPVDSMLFKRPIVIRGEIRGVE
jgi:FAD synthase